MESWGRLFPKDELDEAQRKYEARLLLEQRQEAAAKRAARIAARLAAQEQPAPKTEFIYRPRSESDWDARASQQPARRPRWERVHGRWCLTQAGRDDLARKVKVLLELAAEYQDETDMEELAKAANMSTSWVRKHLGKVGIRMPLRRQRQS